MLSRDFCYWLQGFFEIQAQCGGQGTPETVGLNAQQVSCIRNHLALVFKHEIDPSMGGPDHQKVLNEIHQPKIRC